MSTDIWSAMETERMAFPEANLDSAYPSSLNPGREHFGYGDWTVPPFKSTQVMSESPA